jgi:hypothetical protein
VTVSVPARVALCLVVLLAGCGGGTTPGDRADATPATVTPAPVPTDERPTVREGVDGERLRSLVGRHEASLSGRSFTAVGRRVVTGPVGVLLDTRWERRVAADRGTYHAVRSWTATWGWSGPAPVDSRHRYHAGDRTLTRFVRSGEVAYDLDSTPPTGGPLTDLDGGDHLAELLVAFETWRVVRHPNGSLRLAGRDILRPGVLDTTGPLSDPRNATADVRIAPRGRVTRVEVRFDATVDGTRVSVVEERRFVGIGSTATERPPWYEAAIEATASNATGTG